MGGGERGRKGKGQGTYMKDTWTKTMGGAELNAGGGHGYGRESNGGKMGTTVTKQQ